MEPAPKFDPSPGRPLISNNYADPWTGPDPWTGEGSRALLEPQPREHGKPPSPWLDPRFLLAAAVLVAGVVAGYVQNSAARAALEIQAAKIEASVARIETAVATHSADLRELRADFVARGRELDRIVTEQQTQAAWIQQLNKDIARLQAHRGQ